MIEVVFMLMFFASTIVWECYNIRKKGRFLIINFFGFMYGLTYGLLPALVIIYNKLWNIDLSHLYYRIDYSNEGLNRIVTWFICAIIAYIFIQIFYYKLSFFRKRNYQYVFQDQTDSYDLFVRRFQVLLLICLPIGIVSMYLWTLAYGGIFNLIMIADLVRDGKGDVNNSIAFFMRPAKLVLATTYMSLFLIKKGYKVYLNSILFAISFVASVLLLLALDGRLGMVTYIIAVILIMLGFFESKSFSLRRIVILTVLALFAFYLIMKMDEITFFIRASSWGGVKTYSDPFYIKTLMEFSYIITGSQNAVQMLETSSIPYLLWDDIKTAFFAWLPSSMKPSDLVNVWTYNTILCTTTKHVYGQLPCDFITTSLYDLGIFGPIVFSAFWGKIMLFFDELYIRKHSMMYDVAYIALTLSFIRRVNYCLLYDFVLGLFYICLAYGFWLICKRRIV